MSNPFLIAFIDTQPAHLQARTLADQLLLHQVETKLVPLGPESLYEALLRGDVDVLLQPLPEVPLEKQPTLVIAGLSERRNPADCLLVRKSAMQEGLLFKLKSGARVACAHGAQAAQMQQFRPDVVCEVLPDPLLPDEFDAIVRSAESLSSPETNLSGFVKTAFHPREFVPLPGQGVTAWLCHRDNHAVRKLLQRVHHPEVSACTNIERGILRATPGAELGVYVERDASGWYHLWAAGVKNGEFCKTRLSQSTSSGMVSG